MNTIKRVCSLALSFSLIFFLIPQAHAASAPETFYFVEDLGNGITVESTLEVYPSTARNTSTWGALSSNFKNNGVWVATVTLKAYFTYNGMTAGVTGTEYAKDVASGWTYTNHKITTTTVSSSSGGTATLTATLKDFPISLPIRLSVHCAPDGTITKG